MRFCSWLLLFKHVCATWEYSIEKNNLPVASRGVLVADFLPIIISESFWFSIIRPHTNFVDRHEKSVDLTVEQ
jgi:hypothetical protein